MDNPSELDHRFIVVIPDDAADAIKAAADASSAPSGITLTSIATAIAKFYSESVIGKLATEQVAELIDKLLKARSNGADISVLRRSESKEFRFPPGHPRHKVVYAQHPATPLVYYTASSFHRQAFEHKFAEVVKLLASLGAREIKVEYIRGWKSDFATNLSVSAPTLGSAAADVSKAASEGSSILFEANLEGHDTPALPDDLIWYHHEPLWQSISNTRIQQKLEDFSLTLNYSDDYGINASFKGAADNAGFDLGGKFEEHVSTTWRIFGTFGPRTKPF